MQKVADFLEVKMPKKDKILNYFKNLKKDDLEKLSKSHSKQLSKPVYTTSVNRWRKEMPDEEKRVFKKIAGNILIREGYEKNRDW